MQGAAEDGDIHHLQRFLDAQHGVYAVVLAELRAGRKASHWMWFVFPQLKRLGHSWMAQRYGIASLKEARAYLNHPILGLRLRECTRLVNQIAGRSLMDIFGSPDDLKFRSSMTLFARTNPEHGEFAEALNKYGAGRGDARTVELISREKQG